MIIIVLGPVTRPNFLALPLTIMVESDALVTLADWSTLLMVTLGFTPKRVPMIVNSFLPSTFYTLNILANWPNPIYLTHLHTY